MPVAPRVFISYSHDDDAHKARVLALADRLRHGCTVVIDQYHTFPPEGWPLWCEKQIEQADRVLLVCTETYHSRVRNEEEPGKGLGVLYEAHMIRQELYDEGGVSTKYVPVLFSDGSVANVPRPVRRFSRYVVDTDEGFEQLYRLLTDQPATPPPEVAERIELPMAPRPGIADGLGVGMSLAAGVSPAAALAAPTAPAEPQSRAAEMFVGRGKELEALARLLLRGDGRRMPVVVSGMAGVGKTYLVDRVFADNRGKFPGGYVRLSLDPENLPDVATLLAQVADRLKLAGADAGPVLARLMEPLTLLHVENIDTSEAGRLAGDLAAACPQAALVFSARLRGLGTMSGWGQVALDPFGNEDALAQLRSEVGEEARHQQDWPELVVALGRLPLALHLAAGHLKDGETPKRFLQRLRAKGLALQPVDPADPAFRERSKALLSATFDLSLAALTRDGGAAGAAWEQGLLALGWATAAGVGESLGAAIAGLDEDGFADMASVAVRLSLLERLARPDGPAFRLHPLLAEVGRSRADGTAAIARMTEWFCARLPQPGEGQPWRWTEVHAETPALLDWLGHVPAAEMRRVERAGSRFAIRTGPFHAWLRFCEAALAGDLDDGQRSNVLWTLGNVALRAGLPDRALAAAEEQREIDLRRGAEHDAALAADLIAEIVWSRGDLDEALRIFREELLPAFERLGDMRSRALTMGRIADILKERGDLDEALRIHTQEGLPVYERLGDVRSRAVTMGKIADILQTRGDLDEALRIRREQQITVFERLGDVRSCALAMGRIADILRVRGDLDEALRIRKEEELPVYGRLGDVQALLVGRANLALLLLIRNREGDRDAAHRLLCLALAEARRLRIPEAQQIEAILAQNGLACDAPAPDP